MPTYYIDSISGNNSNGGTTELGAWATLSKVQTANLVPGDIVLLRRGGVWNERLPITVSGSISQPIIFGAYGSGGAPVIDGTSVTLPQYTGLIDLSVSSNIIFRDIEIRNSAQEGFSAYSGNGIRLERINSHHNQFNGINFYDSTGVEISNCNVHNNSLDLGSSYSGIRIVGSGTVVLSGIWVHNCKIHHNIGGSDGFTNGGNGIVVGRTDITVSFLNALIKDNETYENGNTAQNQAGRGITGNLSGDIDIIGNYSHDNAASGSYMGGDAASNIFFSGNVFSNNHLRGFGWVTDGVVVATNNTVYSNLDPTTGGTGIEFGGAGTFTVQKNIVSIHADNVFAARVLVKPDSSTPTIGANIYWDPVAGAGLERFVWKNTSNYLTYSQWVSASGDSTSTVANPMLRDPSTGNFTYGSDSPAYLMDAGAYMRFGVDSMSITDQAADAMLAAFGTILNSASVRIYSGMPPTTVNDALGSNGTNNLLAEATMGASALSSTYSTSGNIRIATANAITPDSSVNASGTATFFRVFQSGGQVVCQGSVGTWGADMILETTGLIAGASFGISSLNVAIQMA